MAKFIPVGTFDIVIFGATGDLSERKLLPALFHRWLDGQIPEGSRVVGSARTAMSVDDFREFAKSACQSKAEEKWDENDWARFAERLDYVAMDATQQDAPWEELRGKLSGERGRPCVFYLATAPRLYVAICEALGAAKLNTVDARVVLEKPIGTDLASAKAINDGVGAIFAEDAVYRIDHYLGKETVQNLMVLRFGNALFEPVWSRAEVDHVQITVAEGLGVEDRADYYDGSGALRDMVQNHILQLLCLTAMEPPGSMDAGDVRTEKIKVLRALRRLSPEEAKDKTVRAQYTAGVAGGKAVRGYLEELSSEEPSRTETFVAIHAEIDNWRWAGVPFYLRTGKRMAERRSEIIVQFKPTPHSIFGETSSVANRLVIRLQPDEAVRLFVQIKEPGPGGLRIKSLPLDLSYAENFTTRYPDAYERLLMDVVRGNLSLFMRRDEVEAAWSWVDGLLDAWTKLDEPLETYPAGSNGPAAADFLLRKDDRSWWEAVT
ncbi:MAG: glucose-6-phosphate dehydrogenase [Hyphomonadaceae bacterium]